jgi:hypothetical protein
VHSEVGERAARRICLGNELGDLARVPPNQSAALIQQCAT